jgi:hypothetical protein
MLQIINHSYSNYMKLVSYENIKLAWATSRDDSAKKKVEAVKHYAPFETKLYICFQHLQYIYFNKKFKIRLNIPTPSAKKIMMCF